MRERVSILEDIDFELELIHRDEINVAYILRLLAKLKDAPPGEQEKQQKVIAELVAGDAQLRSKRELIEKFIQHNLPRIDDSDDVPTEFERFWDVERKQALRLLSDEENLDEGKLEKVIGDFLFTEKTPLRDDIIGMMHERPALKERRKTAERIIARIKKFVDTFISGFAG